MKCSRCERELQETYYEVPRGAKLSIFDHRIGRVREFVNRIDLQLCEQCCNQLEDDFGCKRGVLKERFRVKNCKYKQRI